MNIGLFVPAQSPAFDREYLLALGPEAESRGFHSLWLGEHVVLFDQYRSAYPYASDARIPIEGERALLEPFTTLALVGAVTERIRLGTGICLVPQRNPVYTAKEVSNLDWLSGGRFDFGVGIGWLREEFEALGVPWERRAARCRSWLGVMRTLWCDPISRYEDEYYRLPACRMYPKPLQKPHPPIHFGGESDAALARVAELGQGWYGFNLDPGAVRERVDRLERLLEGAGRHPGDVQVSVCPYLHPCSARELEAYRDAGVDQVILLALARDRDGYRRLLDRMAQELLGPAEALA